MYQVTITKTRPFNDEEKKLHEEADRRHPDKFGFSVQPCGFHDMPAGQVREKVLDVVLNDAEFAAVKKAVIETL